MCIDTKPKVRKPPPPPQLARMPDAIDVRNETSALNIGQGGGIASTTLLTGGAGDLLNKNLLGKKTLLGG